MPLVKVGSLSKLPPGSVMEAEVGDNTLVVLNCEGDVRAFDGICPHAGGPLGQGTLDGGNLVCPWHDWNYDCRTGVNDYDDNTVLAQFAVKVEGDDILVDVP